MIKGILFDLDGTLLNTLPDLSYITNMTLKDFGYPERSMDEIRRLVGNGVKNLIMRALPEGVALTDEILAGMQANYLKYQNQRSVRYEGVDEMLKTLKEMGIRMAIVSNKPDAATNVVTNLYFPGMIDFATGERAGLNRKPHPDLSELALREIGLTAEECVYAGDSDTDLVTGENAGMETLACTWGFRGEEFLLEHGAVHIVRTPAEIVDYVLKSRM